MTAIPPRLNPFEKDLEDLYFLSLPDSMRVDGYLVTERTEIERIKNIASHFFELSDDHRELLADIDFSEDKRNKIYYLAMKMKAQENPDSLKETFKDIIPFQLFSKIFTLAESEIESSQEARIVFSFLLSLLRDVKEEDGMLRVSLSKEYVAFLSEAQIANVLSLIEEPNRVREISIRGANNLSTIAIFRSFTNLAVLELAHCDHLEGLQGIDALSNSLLALNISGSRVKSLEGLENCTKLKKLLANRCLFLDTLGHSEMRVGLYQHRSLEEIDFSHTTLTDALLKAASFHDIKSLRILRLKGLVLFNKDLWIDQIPLIEQLDLSETNFSQMSRL